MQNIYWEVLYVTYSSLTAVYLGLFWRILSIYVRWICLFPSPSPDTTRTSLLIRLTAKVHLFTKYSYWYKLLHYHVHPRTLSKHLTSPSSSAIMNFLLCVHTFPHLISGPVGYTSTRRPAILEHPRPTDARLWKVTKWTGTGYATTASGSRSNSRRNHRQRCQMAVALVCWGRHADGIVQVVGRKGRRRPVSGVDQCSR
jgi:hypothetical protein